MRMITTTCAAAATSIISIDRQRTSLNTRPRLIIIFIIFITFILISIHPRLLMVELVTMATTRTPMTHQLSTWTFVTVMGRVSSTLIGGNKRSRVTVRNSGNIAIMLHNLYLCNRNIALGLYTFVFVLRTVECDLSMSTLEIGQLIKGN